ncbi:MAG: hypothetical protein GY765_30745 [bacterium]|nr:hypothetical protein [bacterium]
MKSLFKYPRIERVWLQEARKEWVKVGDDGISFGSGIMAFEVSVGSESRPANFLFIQYSK